MQLFKIKFKDTIRKYSGTLYTVGVMTLGVLIGMSIGYRLWQ